MPKHPKDLIVELSDATDYGWKINKDLAYPGNPEDVVEVVLRHQLVDFLMGRSYKKLPSEEAWRFDWGMEDSPDPGDLVLYRVVSKAKKKVWAALYKNTRQDYDNEIVGYLYRSEDLAKRDSTSELLAIVEIKIEDNDG